MTKARLLPTVVHKGHGKINFITAKSTNLLTAKSFYTGGSDIRARSDLEDNIYP